MTTHRITAVSVADFKRLRDVKIAPPADSFVVLIGGKNAQGKSSVLDAMTAAFGGKRALPEDPVRHGADGAEIVVELDGGDLVVKRKIDAGGGSSLEVRSRSGPVRSPQSILDQIVAERFLDPIAFLHQTPPEQRATLLRIVDAGNQIKTLEARREETYAARTETGRDLKRAEAELATSTAAIPAGDRPVVVDVAALSKERAAFTDQQHANAKLAQRHEDAHRETEKARDRAVAVSQEILELEQRLADLRDKQKMAGKARLSCEDVEEKIKEEVDAAAAAWNDSSARRSEIDGALLRANDQNRRAFEAEALANRRDAAELRVSRLGQLRDEQTSKIEKLERRKTEIIAAAQLPVEGLGVSNDGLTLNGVPFAQSSGAERLRVALVLAIAASPTLMDVWIRDGALLDDESMSLVAAIAEKTQHRVWIERVSDRDEGAIIIHDGMVVP